MYERNHNLIPVIDPEDYELTLVPDRSNEDSEVTLYLEDLKKMPSHMVVSAIACAGNRRDQLKKEYEKVQGIKWRCGAIGNALYKGVPLRYLFIEKLGLKEQDLKGKHLVATSYDGDFQGKQYQISIPIEEALRSENEVILAYEMNGEDLPAEHGYPVRLIVPGYIGVRNAKWVQSLTISDEEANSVVQRRDYKIVKA